MQISLGAIWGLISLFSWGVGDYLARIYSTKFGSLRTAFYIRFISLFPPLLIFPVQAYLGQLYNPTDWTVVLQLGPILGTVLALAAVAYYRGLETGTVSIVVAITSAWFAVGVILAFILLGEVLSIQQALIIGHAVPMPVVVKTREYGPDFYREMGSMDDLPDNERRAIADEKAIDLYGPE